MRERVAGKGQVHSFLLHSNDGYGSSIHRHSRGTRTPYDGFMCHCLRFCLCRYGIPLFQNKENRASRTCPDYIYCYDCCDYGFHYGVLSYEG